MLTRFLLPGRNVRFQPAALFAGALFAWLGALAVVPAQSTSMPAGTSGDPGPAAKAASSLPVVDLLGLPAEETKLLEDAYEAAKADSNNPEKVGELGILCQRFSKSTPAIQFLERAVQLAPNEMKWRYYLGMALEDSYEFSRAVEAYRSAYRMDSNYPSLIVRLADLIREKDGNEAQTLYQTAANLSPKDPRVHFGLGECARLKKQNDEAIKHYQKAIEFAPKFARAHGALARLLEAKGDRINAGIHADAERRGREPPVVRDPLYIHMMSIGAQPEWLLDVAAQLIDLGEFDLAITVVTQLSKHARYQDQANKLLGRLHYFRQELDLSIQHFKDYLTQFSGDDENRQLYAQALLELKRYGEATQQYKIILKNRPDDLDLHVQMGIVALLNRSPDAPNYFQQVIVRQRKHPGACVGLVAAYLLTDDFETAGKSYPNALRAFDSPEEYDCELIGKLLYVLGARRADSLMPIEPGVFIKFADVLTRGNYAQSAERYRDPLGTVAGAVERWARKGDYAKAFQLIQHCIETDEGGVMRGAMSRVVQALHRQSAPAAVQFFRDNGKIADQDASLANMLAWIRATSGEAALRQGAEAVRLATLADKATGHKNPEVLDTLAAAYAESGDYPRAVQVLQEALSLKATSASQGRMTRFRERLALYEKKSAFRH